MALNKEQIIKILSLKGVGRKTAFKICNLSKNILVDNDKELLELINSYSAKKEVNRLNELTEDEFYKGINRANIIIENSEKHNIQYVSYFDTEYPNSLLDIDDPPLILNYKGDIQQLNNINGIAIIGTRSPTVEGIKSGEFFGQFFAEQNYNVVSGLAIGCDSAAHRGCLKSNGFTTAILAHGLDMIYPKENKILAEEILSKDGLLLSEYFVGTKPLPNYFVERDRLQAGISVGTIVIQTAIKGGTMHAVNATIKSGKNLAAVVYKSDLLTDKILGNEMLIKQKNAFPLKSSNYKEFLELINYSLLQVNTTEDNHDKNTSIKSVDDTDQGSKSDEDDLNSDVNQYSLDL